MKRLLLSLVILLGYGGFAFANQLMDSGLRWQSDNADVVVIAVLDKTGIKVKDGIREPTVARFRVEAVLRGKVDGQFVLVPYKYSSEGNYDCCKQGVRYLLFLQGVDNVGLSRPIYGRFAIYEVGDHPAAYCPPGASGCAEPVKAVVVPDEVVALVRPVLEAEVERAKLGNVRSEASLPGSLASLLGNQSDEGTEALAVLLAVYVGESPAEDVACELVGRGENSLRALWKYSHRKLDLPGIDASLIHSPSVQYQVVESRIRARESCKVSRASDSAR